MQTFEKGGCFSRAGTMKQAGFSLVELLVALVIGLIIILGAGQLYLTGFLNFRQVQLLGDKQSVLTFASETLVRDIRRAKVDSSGDTTISWDSASKRLRVVVANRGDTVSCGNDEFVEKVYGVVGGDLLVALDKCLLNPGDTTGTDISLTEPVVSGFSATDPFEAVQVQDGSGNNIPGVWRLTFNLVSSAADSSAADSYTFVSVNRTMALSGS